MAWHDLYIWNRETEKWVKAATIEIPDDQPVSEAPYFKEHPRGPRDVLLVGDSVLGRFRIWAKTLTPLNWGSGLQEQIEALNSSPTRDDFIFVSEDCDLFLFPDRLDQYLAFKVMIYTGPTEGWLQAGASYTDKDGNNLLVNITSSGLVGAIYNNLATNTNTCLKNTLQVNMSERTPAVQKFLSREAICFADPDCSQRLTWERSLLEQIPTEAPPALYVIACKLLEQVKEQSQLKEGLEKLPSLTGLLPVSPVKLLNVGCKLKPPHPLLFLPDFCTGRKLLTFYNYRLNHNFAFDLVEACALSEGSRLLRSSPENLLEDPEGARPPKLASLSLIDSTAGYLEFFNLAFVQDQFLVCCQRVEGVWRPIIQAVCPHKTKPENFHPASLLLTGRRDNSLNYGGNFVVSPPVEATGPIVPVVTRMGACGPPVPEQRRAPFGKIVVGDCSSGFHARTMDDLVRTLILNQGLGAQPLLPIDVSWLSVGHVDELVSFIQTSSGPKMVLASTRCMSRLLAEIEEVCLESLPCGFNTGKWSMDSQTGGMTTKEVVGQGVVGYCELSLQQLKRSHHRIANRRLQEEKLDPIRERLKQGLRIDDRDIIELPVYFELSGPRSNALADALTPDLVNIQMRDGHLFLPRPFGPRMPARDAEVVIENLVEGLVSVPNVRGFWHWAFPGETWERIALYYIPDYCAACMEGGWDGDWNPDRLELIREDPGRLTRSEEFDELDQLLITFWNAVKSAPENKSLDLPGNFLTWVRIWIPIPLVDVVEEYVRNVLPVPWQQIHFIDSWSYHKKSGNVHCATNFQYTDEGFLKEWAAILNDWRPVDYDTYIA